MDDDYDDDDCYDDEYAGSTGSGNPHIARDNHRDEEIAVKRVLRHAPTFGRSRLFRF
jgi:hypothetical protein